MTRLTIGFALLLTGCGGTAQPTQEGAGQPAVERGTPLDAPIPELAITDPGAVAAGAISKVAEGLEGQDLGGMGMIDARRKGTAVEGVTAVSWSDLSMQDIEMEDILDSLLYPEEYEEGEFTFPDRIQRNDGEVVSIVGYMIPLEWKETRVPEFMLVRDLLGCCFGGSPQPDEWINVIMEGEGADYFPYIPVIVTGKFKIEGIEDEAGYAAGCFHLAGTSVSKEL